MEDFLEFGKHVIEGDVKHQCLNSPGAETGRCMSAVGESDFLLHGPNNFLTPVRIFANLEVEN